MTIPAKAKKRDALRALWEFRADSPSACDIVFSLSSSADVNLTILFTGKEHERNIKVERGNYRGRIRGELVM